MGLDYSYTIVIDEKDVEPLRDYLKEQCELSGNCACIRFEIDSFIMKYLEGGYDGTPHHDRSEIEQYIGNDGKAKIGCIYIKESKLPNASGELSVSFTAATSSMSLLLRDSYSIHRWFIGLSKEFHSILTYLDLEHEGHRLIYYRGKEINIELKGEGHLEVGKSELLGILKDFTDRNRHF
ncbi:hypothetical protein [Paenibacillus tyrfis]|uniref:hypothetical protein n=1 Tax=Paenibacillus tyrfis TaxID=1501230 RepID=UPI00209F3DD4|nr:hypothetical protein [Paenibacillus tyrfis]MCP1307321.1 hypothetical protein [Paenibacillus tyrfis]